MSQPPNRNQIAQDRYERIVALRKANASYGGIAKQLGVTATVVRYHIQKARAAGDLPPALPTQEPNLARRARLLELWEAGVPMAEIGAELGIEPTSVNTALRRLRRPKSARTWPYPPIS
jgi:DNA-binding CsgD family transcriptional regulator